MALHTSIIHELGKTFTINDALSSHNFKLTLNGTELVKGVIQNIGGVDTIVPANADYTYFSPSGDVILISNFKPNLYATDVLVLESSSSDGSSTETKTLPILSLNSYVELSGDVDNGISPSEITDKSVELSTPITIRGCQEVIVNGHHLHTIQVGFTDGGNNAPVLINGNPAVTSDFPYISDPAVSSLTFDSSGKCISGGSDSSSGPRTGITSLETFYISDDGIDAFLVDGIGFALIETDEPFYTVIDVNGNRTNYTKPTVGASFKIVISSTHYNLEVDGVSVYSVAKSVVYSSLLGTFTPSGSQGYLSPATFTPTHSGTGQIEAKFGLIGARQVIKTVVPAKPLFSNLPGDSTLRGTCPDPFVALSSLIETNSQSADGVILEFHTSTTPTPATKITTLIRTTSETVYAFQKDTITNCYSSQYTTIIIDIPGCMSGTPIDDSFSTLLDTVLTGNVGSNDELCSGVEGARTFFQLVPGSLTSNSSGAITSFNQNTGAFTFVPAPLFVGEATFRYRMYCTTSATNNIAEAELQGEATVHLTVQCTVLNPATIQITGPDEVSIGDNVTYNVTGITGSTPYTYKWNVTNGIIIGSDSSNVVVVSSTAHPLQISVTVNNCGGLSSVTKTKEVNVISECVKVINIDTECKIPNIEDVKVTIAGVNESNRVVDYTDKTVMFRASLGMHNYKLVITGSSTEPPVEIILKNIICP